MVDNLFELNRILLAVNEISIQGQGASESSVLHLLEKDAINAMFVDNARNISFCIAIGLITKEKARLLLTPIGEKFFKVRTMEGQKTILDLNLVQRMLFARLLFESGTHTAQLTSIYADFKFDFRKKVWFYDSDIPKNGWDRNVTNLLFQSQILVTRGNRIELTTNYDVHFSAIRNKIKRTEAQLLEVLKSQKVTGKISEDLTLAYEKNRLLQEGCEHLALAVHIISNEDVFAGYDVISYDGKNSSLEHDRFIEAKGTSGESPVFYWSKNEIEKARILRGKYWVYLWTNVKGDGSGTLVGIFRDPYEHFFLRRKPPDPVLYFVEV
jgi:hypothetical protein